MITQRLQYISSGNTERCQYDNIFRALDHGIKWVQLRHKSGSLNDLRRLIEKVKLLHETYPFTFIINDHVNLVNEFELDGVHLGLQDTSIPEARASIGSMKIIGGTANTFQDVQQRCLENCDYIGLGPLRFTTTKKKLSPVLGTSGYREILSKSLINSPPIFAIGSVRIDDVAELRKIGVFGMAMSKEIEQQLHRPHYITTLEQILYGKYI